MPRNGSADARTRTRLRVGGRAVEVTNLDRVLFPGDGITKGELIGYYRGVAPAMLPYLRERPANLQRFPAGIGRQGFFQQEMSEGAPDWIDSVTVRKEGGRVRHVVIGDAATLVYLANQACITPHTWLSPRDRLNQPDQLIFDLDPSADPSPALAEAAKALGALLRELELTPFLKTTGSRGYHVVVPLDRSMDFDGVRAFAQHAAEELVRRMPTELTIEARKRQRRGKIYVDTLRNAYAHTAVPPFAVRARAGAPVAAPLSWEELDDPEMHPARFTIRDLDGRLASGVNPWRDFRRRARSPSDAMRMLSG